MQNEFLIKSELDAGVPPKQFVDGGKHHYYVRISLDAPAAALDEIDLVKYELHSSFKDRYRVSVDRAKNFEIKLWTYGYFDVKANIILRTGATNAITGYVNWKVPKGMPFDDD